MDQVEEIKTKVDIVEIVNGYVTLKKAGRNWKANCPFHGEKTPSFNVNPELQIFKCFGCGEGGDVYTFLEKIEGMTFGEALKTLADRVGVKLTSYKPSQQEEEKERLLRINKLVFEVYQYLLTGHKTGGLALKYILDRGVNRDSVKKWGLGYAPDDWDFLTKFIVNKKGYLVSDLLKLGLLVEGKNYDRFRNRVMFPLNNSRGEVVGFAGRVLPGADEKSGGKYINTPETELYHKSELLYGFDLTRSEIKKDGFAIVVEGELDAICTYQVGIKNVVAIKGSALTEKQVEILRRVTDRVILALDADMAGNAAARRGIEIAEKMGLYVETVNWSLVSGVKDAADLALGESEKLKELIEKPISIYTFFIDTVIKKFGTSIEGKTRAIKDVLPLLSLIEDPVRKDEYLKELAKKTEVEIEVIRKQLDKSQATSHKPQPNHNPQTTNHKENDSLEKREEYVVGLALRFNKLDKLFEILDLFKSEYWIRVIKELKKVGDVKKLPEELRGKTQDLFLMEDPGNLNFEKEWEKEISLLTQIKMGKKNPYIDKGGYN